MKKNFVINSEKLLRDIDFPNQKKWHLRPKQAAIVEVLHTLSRSTYSDLVLKILIKHLKLLHRLGEKHRTPNTNYRWMKHYRLCEICFWTINAIPSISMRSGLNRQALRGALVLRMQWLKDIDGELASFDESYFHEVPGQRSIAIAIELLDSSDRVGAQVPYRNKKAFSGSTSHQLPELSDNDLEIANYIHKNPGLQGKKIALDLDYTSEYVRQVFRRKLKPRGFYNKRDRRGYHAPESKTW